MISSSTPISQLVADSLKNRRARRILHQFSFDYDIDLSTMHLKSCCTLFLLALVACQAAPSPKIIEEKSISEKDTKLAQELKPEDTGLEKDRAKKSTTFCVEVRSGKEELVPCKEAKQSQPLHLVEGHKPTTFVQSAPVAVQYPAAQNVFYQPLQQPYPQQLIAVSPVEVVHQPSVKLVAPQPAPHLQPAPQLQTTPKPLLQQPSASSSSVSQTQAQPAYPPTPIINIIPPAPTAPPCEKPSAPQQIHTYHVIEPPQVPAFNKFSHGPPSQSPPQPTPQLPPTSPPRHPIPDPDKVSIVPISVKPAAPCKTETIFAPVAPFELVYREEKPQKVVEYLPQEYECSCRAEQLKAKLSNHQVLVYPNGYARSSMNLDYNPTIMEEQIPIFAQPREMEGRHHKKIKLPHSIMQYLNSMYTHPLYNTVQPSYYPAKYKPNQSYYSSTYDTTSPYIFSYPHTTSPYPATNYNSRPQKGSPSYSNVPYPSNVYTHPLYNTVQPSHYPNKYIPNLSYYSTTYDISPYTFSYPHATSPYPATNYNFYPQKGSPSYSNVPYPSSVYTNPLYSTVYPSHYPAKYEPNPSYYSSTYNINPYTFSYPHETSPYPATNLTNHNSHPQEDSPSYSNVPHITINSGPFYRNFQDQEQEAIQEAIMKSNNEQTIEEPVDENKPLPKSNEVEIFEVK